MFTLLSTHICFFLNATATTEIYTLSLHDALPISIPGSDTESEGASVAPRPSPPLGEARAKPALESGPAHPLAPRSEEHTSELQSLRHLVCRLLLEKKKKKKTKHTQNTRTILNTRR